MSRQLTLRTEHNTEIQVHDSGDYVDLSIYDHVQGHTILSFTPAEARAIADAVLTASQLVEDRLPHGNS